MPVMQMISILNVILWGDPPPLIMASAFLSLLTMTLRTASLLHHVQAGYGIRLFHQGREEGKSFPHAIRHKCQMHKNCHCRI